MKVGDLVRHKFEIGVGLVLQTPLQTMNGDYLIHFTGYDKPGWYRERYLELVSASR